ncbi:hypothetical protein ACOSQ3_019892 [Xanthoceras sorbifolium]
MDVMPLKTDGYKIEIKPEHKQAYASVHPRRKEHSRPLLAAVCKFLWRLKAGFSFFPCFQLCGASNVLYIIT